MSSQNAIVDNNRKRTDLRERRNKRRAVARIVQTRYPVLKDIPIDTLVSALDDGDALDRYWRLHLSNRPNLRGSDYETKHIVEQRKEVELGYSPSHFHDVKKLKTL